MKSSLIIPDGSSRAILGADALLFRLFSPFVIESLVLVSNLWVSP
ncbi:hypothetical protein [Yersinia massiliensis]|nr:hypothetical protein [Yersinia massiliensis]